MKSIIAILFYLLVHASNGQRADTTHVFFTMESSQLANSYNQSLRKRDGSISLQRSTPIRYVSKGHVIFGPARLVLSPIENEILDRESIECKAMIDRNQETLKSIWLRDFSLDELTSELMNTPSGLPFYASLSRMIEKMYSVGEFAFTSGVEQVRKLNSNGKLDNEFQRNFFHTWVRSNGVWKLSIKTYTVVDGTPVYNNKYK